MTLPTPPPERAAAAALPRRGRPHPRWLVPAGLGASVVLHVLAFLLIRFHGPSLTPMPPATPPQAPWLAEATELVSLRVVTGETAAAPERPRPRLEVELPDFPAPAPVSPLARERPPIPAPIRSVRERLSATEQAARLSAPPQPVLDPNAPLRTLEDEIAALAYQLGIYNDSLVGEWARQAKATDWTVRDAEGGRWGVSPGKIHLGKLTLPLPIGFAPSQDVLARMEMFDAIRRQAGDAAVRATLEERGKAVRARRDAARKNGGGG